MTIGALASVKQTFDALGRGARIGLVAGTMAILVGTVVVLWLVFSPRQELLFGNLGESDAAEIAATLGEWKVPYSLEQGGSAIMVDSTQVLDARMRLVSAGIPKGGHVGYELFDDNEFGVTEFAQRINYQRALQGELERTIASIPGVQNVRVHLSIRRAGSFLGEDGSSKASIALTLLPGTVLERRQVAGIRNLVASAVEGLSPSNVVVVGPAGLQLGGGSRAGVEMVAEGAEAAAEMSSRLQLRLEQMLGDALPGHHASVSVDVRMNFDQVKRTLEKPLTLPGSNQGVVVRRSSSGGRPVEGPADAALVNEQVEYAHGMEREEVTRASGVIERISIAVVLPAGVALAERDRLARLVSTAAGLDTSRGDSIEISSAQVAASAPSVAASATTSRVVPPVTSSRRWDLLGAPAGYLWLLLAFVLGGIAAAVFIWPRRRQPALLSREESERAAQQVRAWLSGGAG